MPAEALIVKKEGPRKKATLTVLEVRTSTQVRPFRMDRRAGPGGHRGGEDGGFILESEEVQEPEKGGLRRHRRRGEEQRWRRWRC